MVVSMLRYANVAAEQVLPAYGADPAGNSTTGIYPCTWAGMYDFLHGVTAYRSRHYPKAVTLWKSAASHNCAMAAYNLAVAYFFGAHVAVNQPLGVAWMSIAADARYTEPKFASLRHTWKDGLSPSGRSQARVDYMRLQDQMGYRVQSGQTLLSIAQHFGISIDALRAANPGAILPGGGIQAGQTLSIPQ